ncbi:hypothetical protein RQP54_05105 [Curvibacter sp. APW13]|uniref:hypothetical protein n=1 Tax=Curvibacter sp. APW13 TaxID=3077236 RepID=UPI0028DEE970|nr:hypothetical protein [Curvibacter sp. APW13]MDT8990237.1 hypothetical protein [Curvibacter sp. APW13]
MHFTQELAMTRFVPAFTPRQEYNPTVSANASPVWGSVAARTRTASGIVLAVGIAATLAIAHQVIDSWLDSDSLLAWVSLWMAVFVLLALFAPALRRASAALVRKASAAMRASRQRAQEAQLWELAGHDPRILTEIRCAQARAGD